MGTGRSRPHSRSQLAGNETSNIDNCGSYRGRGTDLNRSESGSMDEQLEYKEKGSMESERKGETEREKRESTYSGTALESGKAVVGEDNMSEESRVVGEGDKSEEYRVPGTGHSSLDAERTLEDASKAHEPKDDAVGPRGDAGETRHENDDIGIEEEKNDDEMDSKVEASEKEASTPEEKEKDEDLFSREKEDSEIKERDNNAPAKQTGGMSHGAKVSHGASTQPPTKAICDPAKFPWPTNATTISEVVDDVWSEIDDQCQLYPLSHINLTQSLTGWKVVRLFVSSTFHDFQNEREILVKKVFPELKEWCEKRHIHFIECDLRWGVPRDSTTRTVLCTCMEEIDRCHEDTEGEPFFLNMLGDRYGWVPTKDDVPEDIAKKYEWVGNSSITHMEILHGAYRFCNRNAAFFLREVEDMPDDVRAKFADPTDLGLRQIDRLRKKLASRFPDQAQTYTCQYDPTETSSIKLVGLEKFGQGVLDYFKMAIDRKYPKDAAELTAEQQENDRQTLFLGHKGQLIYGREREVKYLQDYVTGAGDYSSQSLAEQWQERFYPEKSEEAGEKKDEEGSGEKKKDHDESETKEKNSHSPVAVVAQSGQGKSSLMARFIVEAKQAGLNVFFHLVGCSGESLSLTKMLARLCRYLAPCEDERMSNLREMSTEDVVKLSRTLLKEYTEEGKQLLIAIDDLTQLELDDANWSDWIPDALEGKVYMVFSLVLEEYKMKDIQAKVPSIQFLELGHLDHCARVTIVENYFAQYNKKLDAEQLDILTRSPGAENALWLALACEELRVFGAFEALTALVRDLPDNLEGLVCDILHRLTTEDETGLVEKTLCYLECCMKGLTEQELECLLGDMDTKTPIPKLHLAMVRRTLKPFLRKISGMCKVECITFFHHAIGLVVRQKWLADADELSKYHLFMADYYLNWYEHSEGVAARNGAFHLSKSNDKGRLVTFLTKDRRSRFLGPALKSSHLKACRCRTMINAKGPFHTQLFLCDFCGPQRNAYGNEAWSNAESCMLCGQFVPLMFRKESNKAYRCQRHPMKRPHLPNAKTCMLCSRSIMKEKEKPVFLCQFCQMGGFPTCCNLNTDRI
ncbi:TPR repeat-containing protein DDB_G0287407 [Strongylocentrotus purpuratus]|uniref:DUF4062 domain-containing protein n=1 Tax=Strongylocentrotus purpuratus TaxID=7668 RepID=A0A7M7HPJ9_STRPU|nr:TPR repeat-containing protein DDB_G0287407 [Strongylocentrotus purpuratus]